MSHRYSIKSFSHCAKLLGIWIAASATLLPMPATYAQDFSSGSPSFSSSKNLTLSPDVLNKVIAINEYALNVRMTPQERQEFGAIVSRHWNTDGNLRQTVSQLLPAYDQLMQLPEATRRLTMQANKLIFLRNLQRDAAARDEISILMLRAYHRVHPPLMAQVPYVSAEVADAFINAYVFINELKSGQNAPPMNAASRNQLRMEVAGDFARMSEADQNQFVERLQRITTLMISWPQMDPAGQLMARAGVGAPLSMQEQQMVQQLRHQVSNHSMQMMTNELNFMAQNQQTIMGSAPYWNPASQSWEQKGGIVTEFR